MFAHLYLNRQFFARHEILYLNLAGYKLDEHDRDSPNLRLQFARRPGARSGSGYRGKH